MAQQQKLILVLGGSTFMGKTLLQILDSEKGYKTFYINRGRKYWNNDVKKFVNLSYYNGNREDHHQFTKLLRYISLKNGITTDKKWHAIIDFSAFKYPDIQSVRNAVEGLCNLYVFISTDSIYDVKKSGSTIDGHKEFDSIPQLTEEEKKKAKEKQEYGYNKLKCQIYLQKSKNKEKFPYISLILPDVIGPFDDTGRFWAYMKWIQSSHPIQIDKSSKQDKFSLVYSKDVVNLIYNLIKGDLKLEQSNLCRSYNISCNQHITLYELIQLISAQMRLKLAIEQKSSAHSFYPSVDYGYLDTSKSKKVLLWSPTPLKQAVKETVQFFTKAANQYNSEREYAQKKLRKKLKR